MRIKPDKLVTEAEIQAFSDMYPPSQMAYLFDSELEWIATYLSGTREQALKTNDFNAVFEGVVKGYGCPLGTGRCFFKDVFNIDIFEKIDIASYYQSVDIYLVKRLYETLAKNEKSLKIPEEAFLSNEHEFSFKNITLVEFPEEFTEIGVNKHFRLYTDVPHLCIKGPTTLKTIGIDFAIQRPSKCKDQTIGAFKTEKINDEEVSTFEISKNLYDLLKRFRIEFGGY